eukprot:m.195799 g.195799  ORF g.195799 m.195799 type:complete len:305 (+) comp14899_c1_seq5:184-1098(+)
MTRRVWLWTAPRCVSTAFERAIIELHCGPVLHEPFGNAYYFGKDRVHERYQDQAPDERVSFQSVLDAVLAPESTMTDSASAFDSEHSVAFSKDMAYYVDGKISRELEREWLHTFLIRHPCKTVTSLWKKSVPELGSQAHDVTGWTYFDVAELGFAEVYRLFDHLTTAQPQQAPIVVDADQLLLNPQGVMRAYCQRTGLPFQKDMTSWEPGRVPEWEVWPGWHDDAIESSGLVQRSSITPPKSVDKVVQEMQQHAITLDIQQHYDWSHIRSTIQEAVVCYEAMVPHCLQASQVLVDSSTATLHRH